jgi:hypothetical protein
MWTRRGARRFTIIVARLVDAIAAIAGIAASGRECKTTR